LEQLLDDAREQYQALLLQVKNSTSNNLQKKILFYQKNLEQLTKAQQELINENEKLKIDNTVRLKQIAQRDEKVHNLEIQLKQEQDKNATGEIRSTPKQAPKMAFVGGRVAKPIKGGGGNVLPVSPPNSGQKVVVTPEKSGFFSFLRKNNSQQDVNPSHN